MKGDLRLGILLQIGMAVAIVPRFWPSAEAKAPPTGNSSVASLSPSLQPTTPSLPIEPPKSIPGTAALTDILPDALAKPPQPVAAPTVAPVLEAPTTVPNDESIAPTRLLSDSEKVSDKATPKESPLVTEFVPFEEKTTEPPAIQPPVKPATAELPVPAAPSPPGTLALPPGDMVPTVESLGGAPEPTRRGVKVPSLPGSPEPTKATPNKVVVTTAGRPIHPFYQRYLDSHEYVVHRGDTLENLAYRLYGDEKRGGEILQANPDLSATDPLPVGKKLRLP